MSLESLAEVMGVSRQTISNSSIFKSSATMITNS
ncbi:hypothetical protein [Lacticaseibacillus sp. 53-4]|nr:hypothetical protein [Lacticaseibacillus sp. 53-4]